MIPSWLIFIKKLWKSLSTFLVQFRLMRVNYHYILMLLSYFNRFSLLTIEKSRFFSLTCKPDRQTETPMSFWRFLDISQVKHHSNPLTILIPSHLSSHIFTHARFTALLSCIPTCLSKWYPLLPEPTKHPSCSLELLRHDAMLAQSVTVTAVAWGFALCQWLCGSSQAVLSMPTLQIRKWLGEVKAFAPDQQIVSNGTEIRTQTG